MVTDWRRGVKNKKNEGCMKTNTHTHEAPCPLLRVGLHFLPRATLIFCVLQ